MSLMFLLSGLFVWPSLQRKRGWGFVRDRLRRLGLPYVFGVLVLIPIAVYPAYLAIWRRPELDAFICSTMSRCRSCPMGSYGFCGSFSP